ncbi:hypothetical protein [Propioniciclava sinopodophylli]|uniref:hypothetical protein n=1 Tax=Propioniciclava sinopodophylli TaxID=1837344 RepID=UPI0024926B37|nr:hypothetical protein [Propioniciclava sinopodophylli]
MHMTMDVLRGAVTERWALAVDVRPDQVSATATDPDGQKWTADGTNLWSALRGLRVQLDEVGIRLGLNAARPDVQPSRMSLQMGGGRQAYAVTLGRPASREDLIDVLDPAPLDTVGTVSAQDDHRQRWLDSLG